MRKRSFIFQVCILATDLFFQRRREVEQGLVGSATLTVCGNIEIVLMWIPNVPILGQNSCQSRPLDTCTYSIEASFRGHLCFQKL